MGIFDDLKSIAKVLQEAGKIDLYQKILEIQEKLLEYQKKITDLEKEKNELGEKLKIKEKLIYENNAYWIKEKDKKDGPFCTRCYDKNKDIIRMHPCGNPAYCDCPECKTRVQIGPDEPVHTRGNIDSFI